MRTARHDHIRHLHSAPQRAVLAARLPLSGQHGATAVPAARWRQVDGGADANLHRLRQIAFGQRSEAAREGIATSHVCVVCAYVRACVRVYVRWCVVAQATWIASSNDARAGLPRNRRLGNYVSASFAVTAVRRCRQYSGNVLRCSRESSGGARRDDVTQTVFLRRECPNTGVCQLQ